MKKALSILVIAVLALSMTAGALAAESKTDPVEIVDTTVGGVHQDWTEDTPSETPTPEDASDAIGVPEEDVSILWTTDYDTETYPADVTISAPGTDGLTIYVLEYIDGEWQIIGSGTGPTVTVPISEDGPITVVAVPPAVTPTPTVAPTVTPTPTATPTVTPTPTEPPTETTAPLIVITPEPSETPEPSSTPSVSPEPTTEPASEEMIEENVPVPGASAAPAENPDRPVVEEPEEESPAEEPEQETPTSIAEILETWGITDPDVPLTFFGRTSGGAWALVNLICAVLTVIFGVIATVKAFRIKRKKEECEYEGEKYVVIRKEKDDGTELIRKQAFWKSGFFDLITSAAAVIAFILTENIWMPMCLIDKWTILMAVILAACLVIYRLTVRGKKLDEELAEKIMAVEAVKGGKDG